MAYTLEQFCADTRAIIKADEGDTGRDKIRVNLAKLLANPDFAAENSSPDLERGTHTLYHDEDTDFHVLCHVFANGTESPPHDHGPSWAVYGQLMGNTEMTVWERKDGGTGEGHAEVEPVEKYTLDPGQVGVFHPGQIHSIKFPEGTRLIRVTGTDLDQVSQARYDLRNKQMAYDSPMAHAR